MTATLSGNSIPDDTGHDGTGLGGGKQALAAGVIPQLRTTNLAESIRFYTTTLGLTLEFQHRNF